MLNKYVKNKYKYKKGLQTSNFLFDMVFILSWPQSRPREGPVQF